MKYKYSRMQVFGKRLKVPKEILMKVYNCTLSFNEFIEYELDDKIPTSCIIDSDRKIVEKFGLEKSKQLDWDLLNKRIYYNNINLKETLMRLDENTTSLNESLYEMVKNEIRPSDYSKRMQTFYPNRLFTISENNDDNLNYEKSRFNDGEISLKNIIYKWNLYKDKDLSYCLLKDSNNNVGIDDNQLKKFMNEFGDIANLILENTDIYSFLNDINNAKDENERQNIVKKVTDVILDKTLEKNSWNRIELTNNQYRQIFNYSSMEDYLKKDDWNTDLVNDIFKELEYLNLPKNYLLDTQIPFELLKDYEVLCFLRRYGIKNVVDFDNESGNFFTKNNCKILKTMYDMYMYYPIGEFYPKKYDENGNYVDRPYTKDEFYEVMKKMIINGPTDWNYKDKAPDYRDMTGEFRERFAELFISKTAPEELQKLFYTKSITPQHLVEHPEYIPYLKDKDLSSCFKSRQVYVKDSDNYYENLYNFINQKTDFNSTMNFITEYSDIFEIVFDRKRSDSYQYEIKISIEDNVNEIQKRINESFRRLIIEKRIAYPKNIPQNLIANYPSMFLSSNAPQELKESFYNRTINSDFILSNLSYREYLKNVDLEVIYKYMPIKIMDNNKNYNLTKVIKETFGTEDGFDVMLLYGRYIDKVFEENQLQNFKLKRNFSKDDFLDEIDKNILHTIIDGKMKYDANMPSHFQNNNPTLFLSQNVPQNIQDKFYNREFTLTDFLENKEILKYFENTDIAASLDTSYSKMIGLFDSHTFLELMTKCGEMIKNEEDFFNYLRSKKVKNLNYQEIGQYLFEYFKHSGKKIKYVIILNKIGYKNEEIEDIQSNLEKLLKVRPELDINNPALSGDLLTENVVNKIGYNVISEILEYNSGANNILIEALNNNDELIIQWINYIQKLPIYNKKTLHFALLNYNTSRQLIEILVKENIELNKEQIQNLSEIFIQRNKYEVCDMNSLTDYREYRNSKLKNKIESGTINEVKDSILEILFNVPYVDTLKIFRIYGLNSQEFIKILIEKGIITIEDEATIAIIREILNINDVNQLKEKFEKIIKLDQIRSLFELENKIKKYYGNEFKTSLFKADGKEHDGVQYSIQKGIDVPGMLDINGNPITSDNMIKVVELEGIDFKLLIHKLHDYDPNFSNLASKIMKNPAMWNQLEGASTLSTSMISDQHMNCVGNGNSTAVYYGFNDISEASLMLMGRRDIYVEHGGRKLEPTSNINEFMIPDVLQICSNSYNEVALDRKSGSSQKLDHRLQPNCIICFDGIINDESKKAAQYFNIPIYMIHRQKYYEKNQNLMEKYSKGEIESFGLYDVKKILYSKIGSLENRYKLFLNLTDKALNEYLINQEEYIQILEEGRRTIAYYSTQNSIDNIDINEMTIRINNIKTSKKMEDESYEGPKR